MPDAAVAAERQYLVDGSSGFAGWHDPTRMRALMQRHILPRLTAGTAAPVRVRSCAVIDARLHTFVKPSSRGKASFDVAYELLLDPGVRHWVRLRAFRGGRSAQAMQQPGAGGAVHLPELDAIAWGFPDDPGLPQLRALMACRNAPGGPVASMLPVDIELVNYRPGQRCAFRCRPAGQAAAEPVAFAKTFSDDRGLRLHARLALLESSLQSRLGDVHVPRALRYDAPLNTLWFRHATGNPMASWQELAGEPALIARMGAALAVLHAQTLPLEPAVAVDDLLADAAKKVAKIATMDAIVPASLQRALALLEKSLPRMPQTRRVALHGDLHLGQWLRHGERLTLLDLDEMACGDPALDLANVEVDLIQRGAPRGAVQQIMLTMIRAYDRQRAEGGPGSGGPEGASPDGGGPDSAIDPRWYRWHALVHWINRAYRLFLRQAPGLSDAMAIVAARLDQACDRFDGQRSARAA